MEFSNSQMSYLVKNWIQKTNMSNEMKEYIYYYLIHDIKNKKKLKVISRNHANIPVFIDIETPCVFHQDTGKYIGYLKNGEIKIVNNDLN